VEDNSLADLQNKLSKINEQLQNGQYSESNIKYTVNKDDLIKQRKEIEKQIKDKEIELQVKVNDFKDELSKLELQSKKLLIDVQVKETGPSLSSFEQAVQSVSTEPITYEVKLNGLKEAMDANDKLIESLQKQIDKYTELGTVGGENYQKLIDKIK
jgi:predicted  nucleic acid-binding Zn-ribbon protein